MHIKQKITCLFLCLCPLFLFPQKADGRLRVADSLLDNDHSAEALKLALRLSAEYTDPDVYVTLAHCYSALNENEKCLAAIEKAVALHVDRDTEHRLNLLKADCYLHLQDMAKAIKYSEKYVGYFPDDGEGLDARGFLFYLEGKYGKAVSDLGKALRDTGLQVSTKAHAFDILGYCYFEQGDMAKAKRYDSLCLATDTSYYDGLLLLAKIRAEEKNFGSALQLYESLLVRDTSFHSLTYDIANCHFYLKEYDKAMAGYKAYLARYPESSGVNNMCAWTLFIQGKNNDALPYANKAIVQDESNSTAYDTRGCILYKKGDYVLAINDFDRCLALEKNNSNSFYYRGLCFLKINRKKEACEDLEKVLADKSFELPEGETPVQTLRAMHCEKK